MGSTATSVAGAREPRGHVSLASCHACMHAPRASLSSSNRGSLSSGDVMLLPGPEPELELEVEQKALRRRRGRSARRHARKQGHSAEPVVDFEELKTARQQQLPPNQLVPLLSSALDACLSDPCGRWEHAAYVLSMLRAESRRLEAAGVRGPGSPAVQLAAQGGVRMALLAMRQHSRSEAGPANDGVLRMAAAGAAALAHLVATGGETKRIVLESAGVQILVGCLVQLATDCECSNFALNPSSAVAEHCVQCCRLLGNLAYGWGDTVDTVKAQVSALSGCVALVQLLARCGTSAAPHGQQVLRWAAHATRNLTVGSRLMQTECAGGGAIEALCKGLHHHLDSLAVQLHGCKALAYLAKGHEGNRARAAAAGSIELAVRLLKLMSRNGLEGGNHSSSGTARGETMGGGICSAMAAEAVEAGCSVIAFVVAPDDSDDRHTAAEGELKKKQDRDGDGRAIVALQAGCVAALTQLAADASSSKSVPVAGCETWSQNHKELLARWTSLALTAVVQASVNGDAGQLQESGFTNGEHSHLNRDLVARTLLYRELMTCSARETFAALHAIQWRRQKVRESVAGCLAALDSVSRDSDSQPKKSPEAQEEVTTGAFGSQPGTQLMSTIATAVARQTAGGDAYIYDFRPGLELEAAGRKVTKGFLALRKDLAALPWVLAGPKDLVVAPPLRQAFRAKLLAAGVNDLPKFEASVASPGNSCAAEAQILGRKWRPWGVAGEHLRRSRVTRFNNDVMVCHSLDAVHAAIEAHGPKVVIKEEFSSSGLGVRVCRCLPDLACGTALERWVKSCLARDGVVTVEPWLDILVEFSAEWVDGHWNGLSMQQVDHMRYQGQWLGDPLSIMSHELHTFVFVERGVQRALEPLNIPQTCGVPNGELQVRVMEVNARTTMSHYAIAAKRRVARAVRFEVLRLSELEAIMGGTGANRDDILCLTDPETASTFCAVLHLQSQPAPTR